jgi:hypothetical protein
LYNPFLILIIFHCRETFGMHYPRLILLASADGDVGVQVVERNARHTASFSSMRTITKTVMVWALLCLS